MQRKKPFLPHCLDSPAKLKPPSTRQAAFANWGSYNPRSNCCRIGASTGIILCVTGLSRQCGRIDLLHCTRKRPASNIGKTPPERHRYLAEAPWFRYITAGTPDAAPRERRFQQLFRGRCSPYASIPSLAGSISKPSASSSGAPSAFLRATSLRAAGIDAISVTPISADATITMIHTGVNDR